MFWLAAGLVVVSAVSFVIGFVLVANGAGVAPQRRTKEDTTGIKRAGSRVKWTDVFRRIPSSMIVIRDDNADRAERLASLGSLFVLAAVLAGCGATLAFIVALIPN